MILFVQAKTTGIQLGRQDWRGGRAAKTVGSPWARFLLRKDHPDPGGPGAGQYRLAWELYAKLTLRSLTALKMASKCSFTLCKLRFLDHFCLVMKHNSSFAVASWGFPLFRRTIRCNEHIPVSPRKGRERERPEGNRDRCACPLPYRSNAIGCRAGPGAFGRGARGRP